jgi:hypothetical protein
LIYIRKRPAYSFSINESKPLRQPTKTFVSWVAVALLLSMAAAVVGIVASWGQPKMQLIRIGMSVEDVDRAIGPPTDVVDMPAAPGEEIRLYRGDSGATIQIRFKSRSAIRIQENPPSHPKWPSPG